MVAVDVDVGEVLLAEVSALGGAAELAAVGGAPDPARAVGCHLVLDFLGPRLELDLAQVARQLPSDPVGGGRRRSLEPNLRPGKSYYLSNPLIK